MPIHSLRTMVAIIDCQRDKTNCRTSDRCLTFFEACCKIFMSSRVSVPNLSTMVLKFLVREPFISLRKRIELLRFGMAGPSMYLFDKIVEMLISKRIPLDEWCTALNMAATDASASAGAGASNRPLKRRRV